MLASHMDTFMILLLCLVPVLASNTQTSTYRKARDYLSITSENYPHTYPGPDTWRWQWSVDTGLWAVMFVDFQLACAHHDTLIISDPGSVRNLTFSCGNPPYKRYAYIMDSSKFSMQLNSNGQGSQQTRGFKCQVLYGVNNGKLLSKIDDMKTGQGKNVHGSTGGKDSSSNDSSYSSSSTSTTLNVILLPTLLALFLLLVVAGVVGVLMLKRRQMQQSNSTSVHLNIGDIRRDSSVSYTRQGNGPPPGPRSRLDSDSSLAPDSASRPRRPTKRSESNASWAMRAEMNSASLRHGSCSSEGGGGGHQHPGATTVPNEYTPCPGELGLNPPEVTHHHHHRVKAACKALPHALACRLSTICEEYSNCSSSSSSSNRPISCSSCNNKLSAASFPVPIPVQGGSEASLAIANAGYMLMTSCSANYVNCEP